MAVSGYTELGNKMGSRLVTKLFFFFLKMSTHGNIRLGRLMYTVYSVFVL